MNKPFKHLVGRGLGAILLASSALLAIDAHPAYAESCGGGPLSTSTGNLLGSAIGGAAGGLLGNQFGKGSGKGVMTGVGVVGGALAGGYAGRSMEGCGNASQRSGGPVARASTQRQAATAAPPRTCRYVATEATIDGHQEPVDVIACLDPADGSWKPASGAEAEHAAQADLVLRTQQRLHDQGFYVRDNIDGQWGPSTSSALVSFQRANGLASTGQLDPATRKALALDAPPAGAPVAPGGSAQAAASQEVAAPPPSGNTIPAAAR